MLAWLHLLALGIGLGAVWARARAATVFSRGKTEYAARRRILIPDNWWGIAAALWLTTGLWRLLGSTEKSIGYYVSNTLFWVKMALFVIVLLLELWPMMTLIRWRMGREQPTVRTAGRIATISYIEASLVIAMVFAAVSMARALGAH